MKTIPLTQGKVAIVDDEDYEALAKYKWFAQRAPNGCWYALRKVPWKGGGQKAISMHRFLMAGASPLQVDHINGNGLDNRRENLRLVTQSDNQRNRAAHRAGRLVGVERTRGCNLRPWRAHIWIGHKQCYLGYFETEEAAHWRFLVCDAVRAGLEESLPSKET